MIPRMISGPSNASPGPGYFQAVQGLVRPEDSPGSNPAAKPVSKPETPQAAKAVEAPQQPAKAAPKVDAEAGERSFPRGSFVDIRA